MGTIRRDRLGAILVAFFIVSLIVPLAPAAYAQASGFVLDCDDESGDDTQTNAAGEDETYTCTVTQGGNPVNGAEVDGENMTTTVNDPDNDADGPDPDFDPACTTGVNGICQFVLDGSEAQTGTANVCFWADESTSDSVFDPAGTLEEDGGDCDLELVGETESNDGTDLIQKTWTAGPAQATAIDCDDESGDDAQTNAVGQTETYTCLVTGAGAAPVQGVTVDYENLNTANDPDNSSAAGTADGNNACTTAANGICTIQITSTENEVGDSEICFWADSDGDTAFDPAGAADNDGGDCNGETPVTEDADLIDVVVKTWTGVTPDGLDCDDVSGDDAETNPATEGEIYTCTATVADGGDQDLLRDPAPGVRIDYENLNGVNDPDNSAAAGAPDGNNACSTGVTGSCTITISPTENQTGTANVCFWADTGNDNTFDPAGAADEDGGECSTETPVTEDIDLIDVVTKTWIVTADILDCDDQSGDDNQSNNAGEAETYTCLATAPDSNDAGNERDPISGIRIDYENLNGVNDPDNSSAVGTPDGNDACTTAVNGQCTISIAPSEGATGTANICFWSDNEIDTVFDPAGSTNDGGGCNTETPVTEDTDLIDVVTKTWSSSLAREIDCTPENANRTINTTHTVTCVVTNVSGVPVSGASVTFSTTGAGSLTSPTVATTDANGVVTATATSAATGSQTITGTLTDDLTGTEPGDVDECDRAANDPAGAPVGDCADNVDVDWGLGFSCPDRAGANQILGTNGDDVINGTSGDDIICSGPGDDIARGRGGNDLILTGSGNDSGTGGANGDTIRGGKGRDSVQGGRGNDILNGQGGVDTIGGSSGADTLRGGADNDSLFGAGGNDSLNGGKGRRDLCRGGPGRDRVSNCERS